MQRYQNLQLKLITPVIMFMLNVTVDFLLWSQLALMTLPEGYSLTVNYVICTFSPIPSRSELNGLLLNDMIKVNISHSSTTDKPFTVQHPAPCFKTYSNSRIWKPQQYHFSCLVYSQRFDGFAEETCCCKENSDSRVQLWYRLFQVLGYIYSWPLLQHSYFEYFSKLPLTTICGWSMGLWPQLSTLVIGEYSEV